MRRRREREREMKLWSIEPEHGHPLLKNSSMRHIEIDNERSVAYVCVYACASGVCVCACEIDR